MEFKQLIADLDLKSIMVFDNQGLVIFVSEQCSRLVSDPEVLAVELLDFVSSMKALPLFHPSRYVIKAGDIAFFIKKYQDFYVAQVVKEENSLKAYYNFIRTYHKVIKSLL